MRAADERPAAIATLRHLAAPFVAGDAGTPLLAQLLRAALAEYDEETARRRAAEAALRTVLGRITGTVAAGWLARQYPVGPPDLERYDGTLADFIRAALDGRGDG